MSLLHSAWEQKQMIFIVLVITMITLILVTTYSQLKIPAHEVTPLTFLPQDGTRFNTGQRKTVFLWTPFFRNFGGWGYMHGSYHTMCSHSFECDYTTKIELLPESDAVIFNAWDLADNASLPATRTTSQLWMLHNTEPPYYVNLDLAKYNSLFNLTSFMRLDSDIPVYYSKRIRKDEPSPTEDNLVTFKDKVNSVAWMASSCVSSNNREKYVIELKKHIKVDMYGECGYYKCKRRSSHCDTVLKSYKFYLSFENGNCKGYVTEKFWRALQLGIIPVVMGDSSTYLTTAPPDSYIDTSQFSTPKHLAEYLNQVAEDETMYNRYMKWRETYTIGQGYWCDMCEALHTRSNIPQVYTRLDVWFQQDTCHQYSLIEKLTSFWRLATYKVMLFLRLV